MPSVKTVLNITCSRFKRSTRLTQWAPRKADWYTAVSAWVSQPRSITARVFRKDLEMADSPIKKITSPEDAALDELCRRLADRSDLLDVAAAWPGGQLELCGEYGVFEWFLPPQWGGQDWNDADVVRGYLKLAAACLNTTFVITQRTGACRRIAQCENEPLKDQLLGDLVSGRSFATVGISHLSTSRQHLSRPVLRAEIDEDAFVLNGICPWVTGAAHAQTVVLGATLEDDRQILLAMPTDLSGLTVQQPVQMLGLTASHTGEMRFNAVRVPRECLIAGPMLNVMGTGIGAQSGGLQTSTLALGLTKAAIDYLDQQCQKRPELTASTLQLREEWEAARGNLIAAAEDQPVLSNDRLRASANSLVLRSAQAAMLAAKGAGYIVGHPAARFCREALFFLVWSCPSPVVEANLCEFASPEE
jgi:alkylation response protein AidB-like acyl-CoA dehydrogenase